MLTKANRLALLSIACLALMSFKLVQQDDERELMRYDVRSAFVTSRSDIPAELMQQVHHKVSHAIQTVTHSKMRPRVILAIRIAPVAQASMLIGYRASARIKVTATAVTSGELVAEAKFQATGLGWTKDAALLQLSEAISRQVISEFNLTPEDRSTFVSALSPGRIQ
jgi:NAD-specific glutamate dehydrogenase